MDPLKRPAATLGLKTPKHRTPPTLTDYAAQIKAQDYMNTLNTWEEENKLPKLRRDLRRTIARVIRHTLLTSSSEALTLQMGRNIQHPEIWIALAGLKRKRPPAAHALPDDRSKKEEEPRPSQ